MGVSDYAPDMVDHCERVDMGQGGGVLAQRVVQMRVVALADELLPRVDASGLHLPDQTGLHQFQRLEGALGLVGQHQRHAFQFMLAAGEGVVAEIDDEDAGDRSHQQPQREPAADQQLGGSAPRRPCSPAT